MRDTCPAPCGRTLYSNNARRRGYCSPCYQARKRARRVGGRL